MWGASPYPLFWFDFSINLLMIIALLGDARAAGAEAQCAKSPKRATACFSPGFQQNRFFYENINHTLISRELNDIRLPSGSLNYYQHTHIVSEWHDWR
jgi:hypothetical protein